MNLKKKFSCVCSMLFLMMLNNCVTSTTSLLAPAITANQTGNIYQVGFSYTSNTIIKKKLGKTPIEYMKDMVIRNPKKDKPVFAIMKKNQLKITHFTENLEDSKNEYNNFLKAVKKVLK